MSKSSKCNKIKLKQQKNWGNKKKEIKMDKKEKKSVLNTF